MKPWKPLLAGLLLLAMGLLAGCGADSSTSDHAASGYLMLRVNPEICVEYDQQGLVVKLTGRNEDGEQIAAGYGDYQGKPCEAVVDELIQRISQAGYFAEDKTKSGAAPIVIQIAPGSVLPKDDFAAVISRQAQDTVDQLQLHTPVIAIGTDDYDAAYEREGRPSPYINLQKAEEIALAQAGVAVNDVIFYDKEFDLEDGTPVYDLEFQANDVVYACDVHAETGEVRKLEWHLQAQQAEKSPQAMPDSQQQIGIEQAKQIVLQAAGVAEGDAVFNKAESDWEHGVVVYELEFRANGIEYDYQVHAETGHIVKAEQESAPVTSQHKKHDASHRYVSLE